MDKLIYILMAFAILVSCKTKQISHTEIKQSDSANSKVTNEVVTNDSTRVKPAVSGEIEFDVCIDDSGNVKPVNVSLKQGSQGMSIKSSGKHTLKAKFNCDEQVNYWRTKAQRSDSLLAVKSDKKETVEVVEVKTEYRTPWYDYVIGGVLLAVIIFLFLKNIF